MCGRFRQNPATKSIPIIMMTGAARWPNQKDIGKRLGANEYVLKPFDAIELGRHVHRLTGFKSPEPLSPATADPPILRAEPAPMEESPKSAPTSPAEKLPAPPLDPMPETPPMQPEPVLAASPPAPTQEEVERRFAEFGVEILILAARLPRTRAGEHSADQLLKSGTSAGARILESGLAESDEERRRLRKTALKNIREAAYWLMLIRKSGLMVGPSGAKLEKTCDELSRHLTEHSHASP
jgi:four helix bundle protein